MNSHFRIIVSWLLTAALCFELSGCKSEPAKPRHQRDRDNVLEEYVKVPLDKAKDFKKRSDQSTQQKSRIYDELAE